MLNEPIEVTLVLESLGVPYLIGGSLASTLYGMVRSTQDSDIVAEMRPAHVQPFVSALQNEFFIDEEMIAESVKTDSSFNIIHRDTMFKPEWYRMAGEVSDRQWRDILGVMKTRADDLDRVYLRKWALELKVIDLLERAFGEAS